MGRAKKACERVSHILEDEQVNEKSESRQIEIAMW